MKLRSAFLGLLLWAGCIGEPGDLDTEGDRHGTEQNLAVPGVHFRTSTGNYVGARNSGGGAVIATATEARGWETFTLDDKNGGTLESGDTVTIRAGSGQYFQAVNGGGTTLNAGSNNQLGWETFKIVKQSGSGTIANGDLVGLQTSNGHWVSALEGGGGDVDAHGSSARGWEALTISGLDGDDPDPPPPPPPPSGRRVIGYLPNWYGSYASWINRVDFSKLTHINLAFALGDASGNLQLASASDIDAFVSAAHSHGVKVFPSLCGGGGDGRIAPFYEPDKVDDFVNKIVSYVLARQMDGIDVDVEAPNRMGWKYDQFIAKLKAKAAPHGLPVTAAVSQWMQSGMSDETLRSFDFVNIMSYDNTGTWTGPGAHSSYEQAVEALRYYENKGVARSKIVLGVPFYGYCWGSCPGGSSVYVLYKDILSRFPNAAQGDWIDSGGAKYSYNGTATLARKTALAEQYGGIMIWELGGDVGTSNSNSLLRAIDQAYH
jgi:chitinase